MSGRDVRRPSERQPGFAYHRWGYRSPVTRALEDQREREEDYERAEVVGAPLWRDSEAWGGVE